jgi:hypothetical protein
MRAGAKKVEGKAMSVDDGKHRAWLSRPDKGYKEYSRTSSGGIIFVNPAAPPEKRWRIEHQAFGEKYFANHDDILEWTVEQARARYAVASPQERRAHEQYGRKLMGQVWGLK